MITKTYTERKKKYKPLNLNDNCLRCGLFEHTKTVQIPQSRLQKGPAGTILILTGTPSASAEVRNSLTHDSTASLIRRYMKEYLTDCEVWISSAVKCYPNDWNIKTHEIRWCSSYIQEDIKKIKPDKIIAMGEHARMSCKELGIEYESSVHPLELQGKATDRTIVESFSRSGRELRKEVGSIPLSPSILSVLRQCLKEKFIGLDFEWNIDTQEVHTIGLASSQNCIAIPMSTQAVQLLRRLCNKEDITFIGHNISSDVGKLLTFVPTRNINCRFMDTLILKRELAPELPTGGLKFFAHSYLYLEDYAKDITIEDYEKTSKKLQDYCAADAYTTVVLYYWFKDRYKDKWNRMAPARDIDMDMILPVAEMLKTGISIDTVELARLSKEISKQTETMLETINTNWGINPASPAQVLDTLHSLGFNVEGTGETILKKTNHPFAKAVLDWRRSSKLETTYTTKIPDWMDNNNRLHCNLHLASTVTGRMTSSKPNMQNIPPLVRPCFQSVFDDDGILMTVDASQSELRCLAYLAKSKYLIDSYNKGIDMHTLVSNMTNIARKDAKTLNFAYVYGASEFRLQQELIRVGQSQYQAKQSTRKYLQSMEKIGIADYQKKLLTFADKYGYNYSIYGRIGERLNPTQVVNFPVQSFSADLNKIRIIQMYNKLREHNLLSRIWLEFHDAMELDVYKPELDTILKLIKEIDTTIPDLENNNIKLDLPLDIKYDRKNWS